MSDLPPGWKQSELGSLADVAIGGTPSRDIPRYWATNDLDEQPWVAISDLHGRVIDCTSESITEAGIANSNVKLVKRGTVLMSFKLSLGRVAFAGCDLYTNEAIAAFLVNDQVTPDYLYYALPDAVRGAATDVAIKGATLNKKSLRKLVIQHPNPTAQEKIASILSTIDTAIEQTEALIEKYQHIKAGLMHDLFTRGVLPNGQLRPPRDQAPELYQETAIGWIPREWTAIPLGSVLSRIDAGWSPECQETPPGIGEWGVLKVSAVTRGVYDPSESKVLPQKLRPDPSIEVFDGDVILTRANGVAELVGVTVQVKSTPSNLMLSDKLLRLVPVESLMTKNFLTYVMQSQFIKSQIDGVMSGSSGQRNIAQSQIRKFICTHPAIEEQTLIDMRLSAIEKTLSEETRKQNKLQKQKLGLMQDLLTGKVPVTVDASPSEAAA